MPIRSLIRYADIREDSRIKDFRSGKRDILWYQAEAVQLDVYIQDGRAPKAISAADAVKWEAWSGTATDTLYINATGSVVNADGGHVRISLTANQSNLPAGSYFYVIRVGGDGIALYGILTVTASPNTQSASYVGTTSPFSSAQLVRDVDWTQTGDIDIQLPSNNWCITQIILYTDDSTSGLAFTLGTPTDPDTIFDSGDAFSEFDTYRGTWRNTTGTFRLAITTAGASGTAGKICLRGFDLT